MRLRSKFENDKNFLILFHSSRKHFQMKWNLIILTDFHSFIENEEKLQNQSIFKFSAKVRVYCLGQNFKMTKTS